MTLDFRLTRADVEAAVAPYVEERFAQTDPRWRDIVHRSGRLPRKRLASRLTGDFRQAQTVVDATYSKVWSRDLADLLTSKIIAYEWGAEGIMMQSLARRRVNHLLLVRALYATGALRVLEVGMGNGSNLALLAAQRPDLRLTGVELTSSGVRAAQALVGAPVLPPALAGLSTEPIVAASTRGQVELVQGTAAALPFTDGSFDAVCTVLALEQMEAIRDTALAELRRVTSRWVIMLEPFRDLNLEGARSDYVRANDYFSETTEGLVTHGLTPRVVYRDFPNKLKLHIALVIAERT